MSREKLITRWPERSGLDRGFRRFVRVFGLERFFVELNIEDRFDDLSLFDQLAILKDLDFVGYQRVLDRLEIFKIEPVFYWVWFRRRFIFIVSVDNAPGPATDLITGSRSAGSNQINDVHLQRAEFIRAYVLDLRAIFFVTQQGLVTVFMGRTKSLHRIGGRLLNLAVLDCPSLFAIEADDVSSAWQFQLDHQQVID